MKRKKRGKEGVEKLSRNGRGFSNRPGPCRGLGTLEQDLIQCNEGKDRGGD
jgi:hypothetical protein